MSDFDVKGALAFILALNVLFFLGQTAIIKINPDGPEFFHENDKGAMIGDYNIGTAGNYTLDEDYANELPTTEIAVSPDSGEGSGYFTDVWQSLSSWFTDTTLGRGATYIGNIVNAFPHFLAVIGAPPEIVFALGFFWHSLTLFLIVIFFKGGS